MGGTVKTILALVLSLAATPSFAAWQDYASRADLERLGQLPQIRAAALADSQRGRGLGDARVISSVMGPQGRGVPANALVGNWRCRQIKLGGMSAYMVYDQWFSCRIRSHNGGLVFEKLNGSQRMGGFLYPEKGAWVYLGSSAAGLITLFNASSKFYAQYLTFRYGWRWQRLCRLAGTRLWCTSALP